jgi:hypothetical protein
LDKLPEDAAAQVELLGLGVLASLSFEGQGQQTVDVAGQEARALGLLRGFDLSLEWRLEPADLPIEGETDERS